MVLFAGASFEGKRFAGLHPWFLTATKLLRATPNCFSNADKASTLSHALISELMEKIFSFIQSLIDEGSP